MCSGQVDIKCFLLFYLFHFNSHKRNRELKKWILYFLFIFKI